MRVALSILAGLKAFLPSFTFKFRHFREHTKERTLYPWNVEHALQSDARQDKVLKLRALPGPIHLYQLAKDSKLWLLAQTQDPNGADRSIRAALLQYQHYLRLYPIIQSVDPRDAFKVDRATRTHPRGSCYLWKLVPLQESPIIRQQACQSA